MYNHYIYYLLLIYIMEDYNRLISSRILDSYDEMLNTVPQPQMLGGKRIRNFVLPGSTDYDYPGSLSVGRMDGDHPTTLGGEFWKDFGKGFHQPVAPKIEGGAYYKDDKGVAHQVGRLNPKMGGKKFNLAKEFKSVGKALKPVEPIAKELGMTLAKEGIKEGVKSAFKPGKKEGGFKIGKALGSVGKELGMTLAKEGIKEGVKSAFKKGAGKRRGRKMMGADPNTYTPKHLMEMEDLDGGVLIRDKPGEYHSSVYPPALASYTASLPKGHDAYGRGRSKLPKSGAKRNSARGAIVAEIMKKKGLSLAAASKYVKEHNLY